MDSTIANPEAWVLSAQFVIPIIVALGAVIGGVVSAWATNLFTRKRQLEAEWRKDKLKYYNQFLDSITEAISMPGKDRKNTYKRFALACNVVGLIAPQKVTDILFEFYTNLQIFMDKDEMTEEEIEQENVQLRTLMRQLILEMRKDLRIKPSDNPDTFKYLLRSPLATD